MQSPERLLCELHAHTTWSDGRLTVRELVDLYGGTGFDVVAITDHVMAAGIHAVGSEPIHVHSGNFHAYLAEIEAEAARALDDWGLLVLPGLELTDENRDPALAAHALAIGLREFVGIDDGLDPALERARAAGALLIGAHPYTLETARHSLRGTAGFAERPEWAAATLDRFELINRHDLFAWVGARRLPVVATGDFHEEEHLLTWKTLLPCSKDEEAVLAYLRSRGPVDLTRIEAPARARGLAA